MLIRQIRRLREEMSDKGIDAYIAPVQIRNERIRSRPLGRAKWLSIYRFSRDPGNYLNLVDFGLTAGTMSRRRGSLKNWYPSAQIWHGGCKELHRMDCRYLTGRLCGMDGKLFSVFKYANGKIFSKRES